MASHPFLLPFERLPPSLPIFPLPNAIVMPGCQLPLNIFEPRYLEMVFDALGAERLIGMVQPEPSAEDDDTPPVYTTGTAGRIVSFNETQDGRLLITLTGVCRFDIREEIQSQRGYRRAVVDWSRFRQDYDPPRESGDRDRLMNLLREYFQRKGFEANWGNLEQVPTELLARVLSGQLPFNPPERQALVETVEPEELIGKLIHLLEFEVVGIVTGDSRPH